MTTNRYDFVDGFFDDCLAGINEKIEECRQFVQSRVDVPVPQRVLVRVRGPNGSQYPHVDLETLEQLRRSAPRRAEPLLRVPAVVPPER